MELKIEDCYGDGSMKLGFGLTCLLFICFFFSCERVFLFYLVGCVKMGVGFLYEKGNGEKVNLKINLFFWEKWLI